MHVTEEDDNKDAILMTENEKSKLHHSERDKTYFFYYALLSHQQNMLMDSVRTTAYHTAITQNVADFAGKVVLDVGAGTGILSFFAAQAGARKVYAVEASNMAEHAETLIKANGLQSVIKVVKGKIEEIQLPEKVDVIISEPMGVLLVHERMMETFIIARDRFLKPAGATVKPNQMFPSTGSIYIAPFSDVGLLADAIGKIDFWENKQFYGVDLSSLYEAAAVGQVSQAVIGAVDPKSLLAAPSLQEFDFTKVTVEGMREFTIPLSFTATATGLMHGIAGWFDVIFMGSELTKQLTTSPSNDTTHWYQMRFILNRPFAVNRGQRVTGTLHFEANDQRSHNLHLKLKLEGTEVETEARYSLHDQTYWNLSGASTASPESQGIYTRFLNS
jgi:histone-arginine methyltransferase CARM1